MKRIFITHILAVIEGGIFMLMCAFGGLVCIYVPIWLLTLEVTFETIMMAIFAPVMAVVCIYVIRYFWPLCFGTLIFTEDYVMWKCLFFRSVKTPYNELKYVKLVKFDEGNAFRNRDYYNTGFLHLLLSSSPLPQKRIDKIRCGKGLIKFPFSNKKLRREIYYLLPDPYNRQFKYFVEKKQKRVDR